MFEFTLGGPWRRARSGAGRLQGSLPGVLLLNLSLHQDTLQRHDLELFGLREELARENPTICRLPLETVLAPSLQGPRAALQLDHSASSAVTDRSALLGTVHPTAPDLPHLNVGALRNQVSQIVSCGPLPLRAARVQFSPISDKTVSCQIIGGSPRYCPSRALNS